MSCSDCPVSSRVLLDKLKKVSEIPQDGYISGTWLNEISTSNELLNQDDSSQTEYNIF